MKNQDPKKAVFAGSFDPFTLGHLWVVEKALGLFDELIILVAENVKKCACFSLEERLQLIRISTKKMKNIQVDSFSGLTVDYLQKRQINFLIRGVRSGIDFEQNRDFAWINRNLYPACETVFIASPPDLLNVSSSVVRELLDFNADVSSFIPPECKSILEELRRKK